MKKPTYMEDLLKIIFVWLGFMFVCNGILCVFGVMKPTAAGDQVVVYVNDFGKSAI